MLKYNEEKLYNTLLTDPASVENTDLGFSRLLNVCPRQVRRYLVNLAKLGYVKVTVTKYPVYGSWVNKRRIDALYED